MKSRLLSVCFALVVACLPFAAQAASWTPTQEIRFIVPYKAGGQSDLYARKVAAIIQQEKLLPVPVLVVNMTGGPTTEALTAVTTAQPDGYTLLVHHSALLTQGALGQIKFKPEDFTSVAMFMENVSTISVSKDAKWKNFDEFLADAKANPGKLRLAMPGVGNVNHFMVLNFFSQLGQSGALRFVPCNGGAEAVAALMGNQVESRAAMSADVARFYRSGDERVLLVLGKNKIKAFPELPTADAYGLKNDVVNRMGLQGPKGLPQDVVATLSEVIKKVTETKEFQEFSEHQASEVVYRDGKDWMPLQQADLAAMKVIVKEIKK